MWWSRARRLEKRYRRGCGYSEPRGRRDAEKNHCKMQIANCELRSGINRFNLHFSIFNLQLPLLGQRHFPAFL
jgi:hypothetical protein